MTTQGSGSEEELQFDHASPRGGAAGPSAAQSLSCSQCSAVIRDSYFAAGDSPICSACKVAIETQRSEGQRGASMAKATLWGVGACVAGAALYYAVIAVTNLEIGLVAIAIGYMVGYAIQRATKGWGGRRYQVLAVGLTYFAVGLAYTPLAYKELRTPDGAATSTATALSPDSVSVATPPAPGVDASGAAAAEGPGVLVALGMMALLVFALPVMSIVSSLPSGLISALIIGFGMQQAWRMTAATPLAITGPYAVGTGPTPPVP
jgi:hypothetical protein